MELQDLRKIGLTEGEIKVYKALLELGVCTKTKLAKESGIAPSNIYDVTNRLIEKGIVSKIEKNNVAHFSPANPNHLLGFLNQKEDEIKKEKDFVNSILPTLLAKYKDRKEKINIEIFEGWNGMKTIFTDLINECKKGDNNYIFGAGIGESSTQADIFFSKFSKLREKKGIITNIIFNEELRTRKSRVNFFIKSELCNVRFINQTTPTEINFYKDKSCIIILLKDPIIIRITGKKVADSFKEYFDLMWNLAKE